MNHSFKVDEVNFNFGTAFRMKRILRYGNGTGYHGNDKPYLEFVTFALLFKGIFPQIYSCDK